MLKSIRKVGFEPTLNSIRKMGFEHMLNSNRKLRFELKLNTNRKMGFELELNSNRKMGFELKLKPKVWLRILTSHSNTSHSLSISMKLTFTDIYTYNCLEF